MMALICYFQWSLLQTMTIQEYMEFETRTDFNVTVEAAISVFSSTDLHWPYILAKIYSTKQNVR
jgi:hypothetical protein